MKTKKFIRRDSVRFSKLGKKRKKLQKWRKPRGRDNKMREKRKSYPAVVSVGYKSQKSKSGKINGLTPVLINNNKQLENLSKERIVIIAKVGAKKKLELIKKANDKNLKILNINNKIKK